MPAGAELAKRAVQTGSTLLLPCQNVQAGSAGPAEDGAQEGGSSRPRTAEGFSTDNPIDKYIRKLESMVRHGAPLWDGSLLDVLAGWQVWTGWEC